jgi:hypothetical protein
MDGDLEHARSGQLEQGGEEAVHAVEVGDLAQGLGAAGA